MARVIACRLAVAFRAEIHVSKREASSFRVETV